jgi:DNA-binding response OmpR family regulator
MKPESKLDSARKPGCEHPFPPTDTGAVKRKILVVDDDPQIRDSLHKVLRAEGYEVVLAANGREGIGKFDAGQIDVMLLDLGLADMSGWDVFGTVTSLNPFVPIIIITGKNQQHDLAASSGIGALIEKPLDVPLLLQIILEMLAEPSETHLKRLVGAHNNFRHARPPHLIASKARRPASGER